MPRQLRKFLLSRQVMSKITGQEDCKPLEILYSVLKIAQNQILYAIMLRIFFLFIIFIHGLIHLLGFVKEWKLAPVSQLGGQTLIPLSAAGAKAAGALWLLACVGFLWAGVAFLLKKEGWWMVAAIAVLLSQLLIILYWPDARAGTVANIIVLLGLLPTYGEWGFNCMVRQEVETLFSQVAGSKPEPVAQETLAGLPPCVQNWLTQSGVVGKPKAAIVHLKQKGLMRTKPGGEWMPGEAEQYFNTEQPGFIWTIRLQMPPGLPVAGRDKYADGKGNMLIEAFSLIPIVNGKGDKIDQGTLLRFLGEIVWFPSAALSPYIKWEEIDSSSARATMEYKGIKASGVFTFDDQGKFISMSAERYMGSGDGATLEKWHIPASEWQVMNGVRIPVKGEVVWKLREGDFSYYQWEITEIK